MATPNTASRLQGTPLVITTVAVALASFMNTLDTTIAIVALLPYNALTRKVEKVTRYLEQLVTCYEVTVQKGQENR